MLVAEKSAKFSLFHFILALYGTGIDKSSNCSTVREGYLSLTRRKR